MVDKISIDEIKMVSENANWADFSNIARKRAVVEAQTQNHTIKMLGVSSKRFVTDSEVFIKSQFLISAYYGFDRASIDYDFYNIESEALGQEMIYRDGLIPEINFLNPLIGDKKTLYRLKSPVNKQSGRFSYVLGINELFKRIMGTAPRIRFCAPYSMAVNLRGYKNLMIDMEEDEAFVRDLFNFLTYEIIIPWIELQRKELGEPKATAGGIDGTATFPNITTSTMEKWIIPYYQKMKKVLNNVTFTTCCGGISFFKDPKDFFYYQTSTCPGIIKGYQWDIESIGFEVFNKYARKNNLDLRLGISAQTLLSLNEVEIVDLVRRYLEEGGSGLSRFSVYLSDIDVNTHPEVIIYAVSAVKQLGEYPIERHAARDFYPPDIVSLHDWIYVRT
ncbi:MAG: hypothetical protein M1371_04265 [Actinobacteria bacterium]|nr:hypothetical protein [Actinomycetota bacterium]